MKPSDIPMKEFYSPGSAPSLTENFAMKILEKEIELEKRPQPSLVSELVELYSQAIEFYNYQNDPKCYDYQDRMHKMLLKPQVISTLKPSGSNSRKNRFRAERPGPARKSGLAPGGFPAGLERRPCGKNIARREKPAARKCFPPPGQCPGAGRAAMRKRSIRFSG